MTTVAYIGNFGPPRSTENAYRYAFEKLGCKVISIQQERAGDGIPFETLKESACVIYTRTHRPDALGEGWTTEWRRLEDQGVQTASVHLDVFVGVKRYGMDGYDDPLFTTSAVFTPDPLLAEYIDNEHTTHHWLPPAADVRDGDPEGEPITGLAGKIAFVGSRYGIPGVHPEYPFRAKLLDWLHLTYGNDFYHYGGGTPLGPLRGKPLWDVYASNCFIVGDSCFAGHRPYYWSDRIPETLAHGGLLIHPDVEGLKELHPLIVNYDTGDLHDLAITIDAGREAFRALDEGDRDKQRFVLSTTTRQRHTYVHRARTILDTLGLDHD